MAGSTLDETEPIEDIIPDGASDGASDGVSDETTIEGFDLDGLSDFERSVVEGFTTSEVEGTPESAVSGVPSPSDPPADAPTDTPAGTSTDTSTGTPADTSADTDTFEFMGTKLTMAQGRDLVNLYEWASSLTPEQAQRVSEALADPAPPAPASPAPAAAPATPAPTTDYDEFTDPAVIAKIRELDAKIAQLDLANTATESSLQAQREAEANRVLSEVRASYAEQHGLNEIEMEQLMARTYQSGVTTHLAPQFKDPAALFTAAFDQTLWTEPSFREREIARIQAQRDSETAAIQSRNRQKAKLSAGLNGSSGSLPRKDPAPRDLTPGERHEAMVAEFRAAQGG